MSNITLINGTREIVRLAVFQTPVHRPAAAAIAWQVVTPPPGGQQIVEVPSAFRLRVPAIPIARIASTAKPSLRRSLKPRLPSRSMGMLRMTVVATAR